MGENKSEPSEGYGTRQRRSIKHQTADVNGVKRDGKKNSTSRIQSVQRRNGWKRESQQQIALKESKECDRVKEF